MTRRFESKVVWITGGGSGIGRALALAFAREGAALAISGRRRERLDAVVKEARELGARAMAVPCDVTSEEELGMAATEIGDTFGRIDVTVANAGSAVSGRIENLTAAQWRRQLDTNVIGVALTAKYAMPYLRRSQGRLVLIGSVAGLMPAPGVGAYATSKAAVRALGQTIAAELGGTGVSCTTVMPGFVESEIAQVDDEGVFDPTRRDTRPHRLMWPADRAAKVILDAVHARRREFVFTAHGRLGAFVGQHLPGLAPFVLAKAGVLRARRRLGS